MGLNYTVRYLWRFITLRKKTEPKQCPLGTVLENGALFSKKGTKIVPFWQSAPHQKGTLRLWTTWTTWTTSHETRLEVVSPMLLLWSCYVCYYGNWSLGKYHQIFFPEKFSKLCVMSCLCCRVYFVKWEPVYFDRVLMFCYCDNLYWSVYKWL